MFSKKDFVNVALKLSSSLLGFFVTVLISRYLQPAASGEYNMLIGILSLSILIINYSAESAYSYYSAKNDAYFKTHILHFTLVSAALQTLVFIVLFYLLGIHTKYAYAHLPLGLLFFTLLINNNMNGLFTGLSLYNKAAFFQFVAFMLQLILLLTGKQLQMLNINVILYMMCVSNVVIVILQLVFLLRTKQLNYQTGFSSGKMIRMIGRFVLMAGTINIIQFLAYRIDYGFVLKYCSATDLGLYTNASKMVQWMWIIPTALVSGTYAKLVQAQHTLHAFVTTMFKLIILLFAGYLIFLPFSETCIKLLLGNSYAGTELALNIMLPGAIVFVVAIFFSAYYSSQNMLRYNLWASSLCLLLITLFDAYWVPKLGIKGAAYASSIAYGLTGAFYLFLFYRTKKQSNSI